MRNKATKKNMDLDLRRYGKMLYSKAESSEEVDYEAIYQFYRKTVLEIVPEEYLQHVVIPEHLEDVEFGSGNSHANLTIGIWKAEDISSDGNTPLFYLVDEHIHIDGVIYFGQYNQKIS